MAGGTLGFVITLKYSKLNRDTVPATPRASHALASPSAGPLHLPAGGSLFAANAIGPNQLNRNVRFEGL